MILSPAALFAESLLPGLIECLVSLHPPWPVRYRSCPQPIFFMSTLRPREIDRLACDHAGRKWPRLGSDSPGQPVGQRTRWCQAVTPVLGAVTCRHSRAEIRVRGRGMRGQGISGLAQGVAELHPR